MKQVVASCPHFVIRDVVAAGDNYQDKLGFTIPQYRGDLPTFGMPRGDNFIVMLNQVAGLPPQPNGDWEARNACFWHAGVDELFDEFRCSGADIFHEPVDRELYGMREFAVRDNDRYVLVFAEDTGT